MHGGSRHNLLRLGAANALAVLGAGAATLLYARWLDAADFAWWAGALALARAGLLLLDGGLKTALVRRADAADATTAARLQRWVARAALLLVLLLLAVLPVLLSSQRATPQQAMLLAGYAMAYWLLYAPLLNALARLERAQRFGPVARAEAGSVLLEFGAPLALWAAGLPPWAALLAAVWLARAWRCVAVVRAARGLPPLVAPGTAPAAPRRLLQEGLGVQALALLSMLRDHLHLVLVAPWFGAGWAGAYALAFSACTLVSQVFVQTGARVSLPLLRDAAPAQRWALLLQQTRQLAIVTLPLMALLPALLQQVDQQLWQGRWAAAVVLLPWLVWRALPSVAGTLLGTLLLVSVSPWAAARAHAWWTLAELLAAATLLWWLGPLGLAVSAAVMAWAGMWIFVVRLRREGMPAQRRDVARLLHVLLLRPSWWLAALLALLLAWQPQWLGWTLLAWPLCWLVEPPVWRGLRGLLPAVAARDVQPGSVR